MQNALIAIKQHPTLGPSVSGRELYKLIGNSKSKKDIFPQWFVENVERSALAQTDYIRTSVVIPELGNNRRRVEYIVTVSAAIQIATMTPARRGVAVRDYLRAYQSSPDNVLQNPEASTTESNTAVGDQPTNSPTHTRTCEVIPTAEVVPTPINGHNLPTEGIPTNETPAQRLLREAQKLVDEEQRRSVDGSTLATRLTEVERISLENQSKLDALLVFFQSAALHLRPIMPPEVEPVPVRTKIVRLVNTYASVTNTEQGRVYRNLYAQLANRTGFDVYAVAGNRKDTYLDVIEQAGQLDNLFIIAQGTLGPKALPAFPTLPPLPTPPAASN